MRAAPRLSFLWLGLLLAPLPPAAAVEKCISPQGKVTYSEQACPDGWKAQTIRGSTPGSATTGGAAAGSAPAAGSGAGGSAKDGAAAGKAPVTQAAVPGSAPRGVTLRYYDVQGKDFETLLAALNASGGFHAKAGWKLSYQYAPKRAGRACSPQSVGTQLDLSMLLPRWAPQPGTAASLYSRWQRYVAALRVHEEGHLQIGRAFEAALKKSLAVVSERCDKLEARVKGIFEILLEQHRKRDEDFDRSTAFGRTQGAELR